MAMALRFEHCLCVLRLRFAALRFELQAQSPKPYKRQALFAARCSLLVAASCCCRCYLLLPLLRCCVLLNCALCVLLRSAVRVSCGCAI
jgi:hypothetical protein